MKTTDNSAQISPQQIAPPIVPLKKRMRLQIARWLGDRKVAPLEKQSKTNAIRRGVVLCAFVSACAAGVWFFNASGAPQKPTIEQLAAESKTIKTVQEKPIQTATTAAKPMQSSAKTTVRQTVDDGEPIKLSPTDAALMQSRPIYKQPEAVQPRRESEKPPTKPSARIAQPFYQP